MNRRKFIASGSSVVAISLSGCLDIFRRNNGEPDSNDEYPDLPSEERVDTPPYEITTPSDREDEWNPHYMGKNLSKNPTRNFSTNVNANLRDQKIRIEDMIESNEYIVRIIDNEEDLNNILNTNDNFNINFDDEILIVVESGFNSSSLMHQWQRVEDTSDGIHIHGYMYRPYDRRLDFESRSSIIRVDKPDNLEKAYVSLTIDPEFRINFNSSEGIVRIPVIT